MLNTTLLNVNIKTVLNSVLLLYNQHKGASIYDGRTEGRRVSPKEDVVREVARI